VAKVFATTREDNEEQDHQTTGYMTYNKKETKRRQRGKFSSSSTTPEIT
jgi:hypothetical protein